MHSHILIHTVSHYYMFRTHHITVLVITPQKLNFISHNFKNYPFLTHIYVT